MGPGGGPGPGGPLPILRALNLTDAQREQVRAIMAERKDTAPPGAKIGELQRKLEAAILADTPDHAAIDELKSAIVAAHNEELAARIDVETRIAQILTPEQRAQARDILSKEPAPGFRGRRGGGFWH
jgi:Spy/CpxP family protein refolding chaperone